jgi:lysophospholipase L1-like esterase
MNRIFSSPLKAGFLVKPALFLAFTGTLAASGHAAPRQCPDRWLASWGSAQMEPKPEDVPAPASLADATLRETIRLSAGGTRLRLRFSNLAGREPLEIDAARVALAEGTGRPGIMAGSDHALTFSGRPGATIAPGADILSDPVTMTVAPHGVVAVSLHLPRGPAAITGHPGSRTTSYLAPGNQAAAATPSGAKTTERWLFLSGAEVTGCGKVLVALGDSITDGHGATTDKDDRWPDILAARLPAGAAIVNQGIGGNRVTLDGLGPSALARFDRDVLSPPGVASLIVLEGINDLGTFARQHIPDPAANAALVDRLTTAYAQIVARARAHGIRAIGATVMPFTGSDYYAPTAQDEANRQAVNRWIRTPGHFDAVVDFDALTRDPGHPERLRPDYDSGDHLHPSPAGYRAMGEAVPVALLGLDVR